MLRIASRPLLLVSLLASPGYSSPVECLHNGEVIGTNDFASVEQGVVSCQDPVTKIILKETEFKNWMIVQEKVYKNGSLQKEASYNGVPGQNKYHGWKNSYDEGRPVREELYEHGMLTLQRIYFADGHLRLATATLPHDKSQKSRVEFDEDGNLIAIQCSRAIIGPKQKKWCGLDGEESTVTLFENGSESRKLTFFDGHLKIYEQIERSQEHSNNDDLSPTKIAERVQKENFSDGRKKHERRFNLQGKLDGVQRYFDHASENLVIEEVYDDGNLTESRLFYPNGRTKMLFVWDKTKGEKRFGHYRSYFIDGGLESKGDCYELADKIWPPTFEALPTFLKHGISQNWDEDGDLREKSAWRDGERHGVTEYYFTRGGKTRMTKAEYSQGKSQREQDFVEIDRAWKAVSEHRLKVSIAPKRSH